MIVSMGCFSLLCKLWHCNDSLGHFRCLEARNFERSPGCYLELEKLCSPFHSNMKKTGDWHHHTEIKINSFNKMCFSCGMHII